MLLNSATKSIFSKIYNMKTVVLFCCLLLAVGIAGYGQDTTKKATRPEDQIEKFWFVLLRTGPKTDLDSITKANLFQGHMANINKLYYDGILKVAGPFGKN